MNHIYLADKIGVLLLSLVEGDRILEDVVSAIVGLASLELGDDRVLVLLLSEVFLQSEGVVLLLGLTLPAGAALGLGIAISSRSSPGLS